MAQEESLGNTQLLGSGLPLKQANKAIHHKAHRAHAQCVAASTDSVSYTRPSHVIRPSGTAWSKVVESCNVEC